VRSSKRNEKIGQELGSKKGVRRQESGEEFGGE
jgi:hypothetical protein